MRISWERRRAIELLIEEFSAGIMPRELQVAKADSTKASEKYHAALKARKDVKLTKMEAELAKMQQRIDDERAKVVSNPTIVKLQNKMDEVKRRYVTLQHEWDWKKRGLAQSMAARFTIAGAKTFDDREFAAGIQAKLAELSTEALDKNEEE